jgi:hypothetical protein
MQTPSLLHTPLRQVAAVLDVQGPSPLAQPQRLSRSQTCDRQITAPSLESQLPSEFARPHRPSGPQTPLRHTVAPSSEVQLPSLFR